MRHTLVLLSVVVLFLALPSVKASQVITDPSGQFSVGIGPDGELFDYGSYIGFQRLADGYDPLAPGSPYDSWSTFANGMATVAANSGNSGGFSTVQSIGANSATSTTSLPNGLTVGQTYTFVAPNVLEIAESVTNSGGTSTDVLFQRDVDWDVFPTEFNENTFASAIPAGTPVIASTSYGFDQTDPSMPFSSDCSAGCNVQGDLGGGIRLDLGILAPGQTSTFNFFYGISQLGEDVNGLDAQFASFGSIYTVSTQSSENGDYPNLGTNSAAIGFGASVPEPSSVALLMTAVAGFGGIAWRRRRKNA